MDTSSWLPSFIHPGPTVRQAWTGLWDHKDEDAGPALKVPTVLGASHSHSQGKTSTLLRLYLIPSLGVTMAVPLVLSFYIKPILWKYNTQKSAKKGTVELLFQREHTCVTTPQV